MILISYQLIFRLIANLLLLRAAPVAQPVYQGMCDRTDTAILNRSLQS